MTRKHSVRGRRHSRLYGKRTATAVNHTPNLPPELRPVRNPEPQGASWEEIEATARLAVGATHASKQIMFGYAKDIAMSAIGLALTRNPDLTKSDCIDEGRKAICQERDQLFKLIGLPTGTKATGERFQQYWDPEFQPRVGVPVAILPGLTLRQVCADLSPRHFEVLCAVAFTDSKIEAAEALGVVPATLSRLLKEARTAALALWFDGETPPPPVVGDRKMPERETCKHGHPWSENEAWRTRRSDGYRSRYCRECQANANKASIERRK